MDFFCSPGSTPAPSGIGSNGVLTPVPGSPFAAENFPFSVAVDPTGKFAYVANEGDNNVSAYSIGPTGALTAVASSPFDTGVFPNSVAVDPTAQFAYVVSGDDSSVSAFSIGPAGTLNEVAGSPFDTGAIPVSVAVDPTDRFAYVANSSDNNVSGYIIGSDGGRFQVHRSQPELSLFGSYHPAGAFRHVFSQSLKSRKSPRRASI